MPSELFPAKVFTLLSAILHSERFSGKFFYRMGNFSESKEIDAVIRPSKGIIDRS